MARVADSGPTCSAITVQIRLLDAFGVESERPRVLGEEAAHVHRGRQLREIAEKSKIGMAYLQALEAEVFTKLPAPVYVRGFLAEYARALGLDAERVKQTYLDRYRAARGPVVESEGRPDEEAAKS